MSHIDAILQRFVAVDRVLVARGFPATSPWWFRTIERWYRSGKRQAVLRVGRRGGKSSTLSRLAVVEGLYGKHKIPPGDIGVVAVISTRGPEALERLRTITAILDTLGVRYRPSKGNVDGVELVDQPIAFRVHVATIAGVSGFTGVFVLCDEVSKWKDADTGVNPASEVIKSVRPTMLTQPNARIVLSSSPMGMLDAHYDAFEEGETALQTRAHAPSWVANPTVTEAETRALEPDETVWAREYAAVPQSESERSLLSSALVERAAGRWVHHEPSDLHRYVAVIDPAVTRNAWTLVVATLDADMTRRVVLTREWQGSKSKPLGIEATFREIKTALEPYRISHVVSDQFSAHAYRELAAKAGVLLHIENWSQALYRDAYELLRTLLVEDKLVLPNDAQFKQDLLGVRVKLTRAGEVYDLEERGTRHSDFAPPTAMAMLQLRVKARIATRELSVQEQHTMQRNAYLGARVKQRERRERGLLLPVTHRRQVR